MTTDIDSFASGVEADLVALMKDLAVDVKGASGSSEVLDTQGLTKPSFAVNLTALAGGTTPGVTITWQHSPDSALWLDIAAEAALTAVGSKHRFAPNSLMRFLRISWVTSGTPTTATMDFFIQVQG